MSTIASIYYYCYGRWRPPLSAECPAFIIVSSSSSMFHVLLLLLLLILFLLVVVLLLLLLGNSHLGALWTKCTFSKNHVSPRDPVGWAIEVRGLDILYFCWFFCFSSSFSVVVLFLSVFLLCFRLVFLSFCIYNRKHTYKNILKK